MCLRGVAVLKDEVLSKIADSRVRVYAVWQPILATDNADELPRAIALLAGDSRVRQYWDPRGEVGKQFARTLDLPLKTPAWDVYLLYRSRDKWENVAPAPAFWMHQLGFAPWSEAGKRFGSLRLDGERFRGEVDKALRGEKDAAK